ncbi:hypothetical protein P171DRAFT_173366 [Karstenula rhodostoma CBS 690.94]|uniref:F-box domain-containing protein n=1 Tax=Karstenula rhodostoma CBS 690.94 TaxID=1392251 RepID=A0A9P4P782_9PLEO|nr:hypothetical protein P171DRAFT_173366 [Karstenula rhodostoma CBS 690.94]
MSPRPPAKALESVAPKSRKRRRDDSDSELTSKRPHVGILCLKNHPPPSFPFLKLPPELRNRIYEFAFENIYRTFPTSSFRKENQPRRYGERLPSANLSPSLIPYLGLVQSCRLIRKEFHPWWMNAHRIPLCNLARYLRTFFPPRPKSDVAYYASQGRLRIYIRRYELPHRDLLPLIKHIHRFPQRRIGIDQLTNRLDPHFQGLVQLLENQHPAWKRWIRANVVSQIRMEPRDQPNHVYLQDRIILVVKEKHVTPWMKSVLGQASGADRDQDGYHSFLASLGLDIVVGWQIDVAVDYR